MDEERTDPPPAAPSWTLDVEPTGDAGELGRSYGELLQGQQGNGAGQAAVEEASAPPVPEAPPPLTRVVEALLFVGGQPLTAARACETVRGLTPAQFTQAIEELNRTYRRQGRPYLAQSRERGYVLELRPRFRAVQERLDGGVSEAKLSAAAIEVLSLVAYRQPATKQEVDAFRGHDSGSLLRQLVRRGLIAVVQRGDAVAREVCYGTTPRFLQLFQLSSLNDLPHTQDLERL